jgi:hypothetical protein
MLPRDTREKVVKPKIQTKSIKRYTTSDAKEFGDKREAERHEAGLNMIQFLAGVVTGATGALVVDAIMKDPDGFREITGTLLRRPRTKLNKFAEPTPPLVAQSTPDAAPVKRRGRPPGSRNRPRADSEGVQATA